MEVLLSSIFLVATKATEASTVAISRVTAFIVEFKVVITVATSEVAAFIVGSRVVITIAIIEVVASAIKEGAVGVDTYEVKITFAKVD